MVIARVRPARPDDLAALLALAGQAGGGLTSLPADEAALAARIARSEASFATMGEAPDDELFLLVLEQAGEVIGTAQLFTRVGVRWPFYSYRLGHITHASRELGRSFRAELLSLTTDLEGASEVGGLFLREDARAAGLGELLARSRYLFIHRHRACFGPRTIAELRGWVEEDGRSPFWDGISAKFFGMTFHDADHHNALNGNQFIADLMPKHPIYTALLPDEVREAMGRPHPRGRPAMRLLEREGFRFEGYLDIFDGGPTMTVATDAIATLRDARVSPARICLAAQPDRTLMAAGKGAAFRAVLDGAEARGGGLTIGEDVAEALEIGAGDEVSHVGR